MEYPYTNQLLYIKRNVINVLLRNSNSEPFKVPVNPELLHVPQYPKLIKCPMDFGTIKSKLDKQVYQTANECKSDFLDVFRNCYIFNEPGSLYVEMALKLENLFKRKMADLPVPEHYVQESAFNTPKSNKIKKGKGTKLNNSVSAKPKLPVTVNSNSVNPVVKPDVPVTQKRNRSESTIFYAKEEPNLKKPKLGIDFKTCKHIILNLVSKKYNDLNRYFLEPVDVEGLKLHDYYDIVKRPMDLGTVKRKLFDGCYQTNEEFSDDVRLVFSNCYLYNPEGHEVHRCGKLLEAVFLKLYQSMILNVKNVSSKPNRTVTQNYDDLQPLLQKILKRQSEIDTLHLGIIKRSREIRQSIDVINNTDFIKSFKASVNNTNNNHKTSTVTKKPTASSNHHDAKVDKTSSPIQNIAKSNVKSEIKSENAISKVSSNQTTLSQQISRSPKSISSKPETAKENSSQFLETKRSIKPSYKSQMNQNEDASQMSNIKKPQNHISNHVSSDNCVNNEDSFSGISNSQKKQLIEAQKSEVKKPAMSSSTSLSLPSPCTTVTASTISTVQPVTSVTTSVPSTPASGITKNAEDYNTLLKEIKVWISSLSPEMGMKVREFINKSENRNVVSVNLQKLKPATINGLHKMMREPPTKAGEPANLREFSIEDRLQLSQDLRLLGEKCSEKILNIYKKTEDVLSSDGECEIDFQTMKLVTLHSLREFADKCLQKKRDKQINKGVSNAVGNNGDISDSDSSDSSDSDASDSNSDASSSSSDNEFFNSLPKPSEPLVIDKPPLITTVPHAQPKEIPEFIKSIDDLSTSSSSINHNINNFNIINSNSNTASANINNYQSQLDTLSSQPSITSDKPVIDNVNQEESRLSDSSDSEKDEEEDDDDDDNDRLNNTHKRPNYSTFWSKATSSDSRKISSNTQLPSKPKTNLFQANPMCNKSASHQLNESLRQIVQDAQAHENVKKQEEELRLVRMKEEEELKKQHMLKIQAFNESRKQMHHSEIQKKEENLNRLKETIHNDRKQRAIDIPCLPEREDYHQILCDFEYNIDQDLIMKLVHLDAKQIHL